MTFMDAPWILALLFFTLSALVLLPISLQRIIKGDRKRKKEGLFIFTLSCLFLFILVIGFIRFSCDFFGNYPEEFLYWALTPGDGAIRWVARGLVLYLFLIFLITLILIIVSIFKYINRHGSNLQLRFCILFIVTGFALVTYTIYTTYTKYTTHYNLPNSLRAEVEDILYKCTQKGTPITTAISCIEKNGLNSEFRYADSYNNGEYWMSMSASNLFNERVHIKGSLLYRNGLVHTWSLNPVHMDRLPCE